MATTRKKTTTSKPMAPQTMGEGPIRDLVRQELRTAFGQHSRDLEKILNDINLRLETLEKSRK